VAFRYRDRPRRLRPYGILLRDGQWYVTGLDLDRDELRTFRLDRVEGEPTVDRATTFQRPDDFDPRQVLADAPWRFEGEQPVEALVEVRGPSAWWVARDLGPDAVVERRPDGALVVRLQVSYRAGFRNWLLGLLDDATVLEPAELRDDVAEWVRAVAAEVA
jgi:proteasome accessory factor B